MGADALRRCTLSAVEIFPPQPIMREPLRVYVRFVEAAHGTGGLPNRSILAFSVRSRSMGSTNWALTLGGIMYQFAAIACWTTAYGALVTASR